MTDPARPAAFPRPPADGFPHLRLWPELHGRRFGDLVLKGIGLCLTCRSCGRSVAISPLGLRRVMREARFVSIEDMVVQAACLTCGAAEFFATFDIRESAAMTEIVLYRDMADGPRLDRGPPPSPLYGVETLDAWP